MGAAFGIVYARVARGERRPLTDLLGELMGMIVLPYLGPAAARREQHRSAPGSGSTTGRGSSVFLPARRDPLGEVRMRLTYRTAQVLECIAGEPGISNRVVADRAGITDQGQISKLLARLERLGLADEQRNGAREGRGERVDADSAGCEVAQRVGSSGRGERAAA